MFCPACGRESSKSAAFCQSCGQSLQWTPSTRPASAHFAGFWKRFVAYLLDFVIVLFLGMAIGAVAGFFIGIIGGLIGREQKVIQFTAGVVGFFLGSLSSWLYHALMESSGKQATLGKMTLNIQVTDYTGERISFARATGRYFAKFISAILLCVGFMMAGWTEKKQALHDIMAGTLVVKKQ
jgi:uncharacterized RDD family membrane protein YckC